MLKFLFDYDNTILNCDNDFLWGKIIEKIIIFKKKNINYIFYKLYEKKIINNYCYFLYLKKFFLNIKKIKIIFNYILKIFQNNYFLFKKKIISTSTSFFLMKNKKKVLNKYFFCTNIKIININNKKILNKININFKKKIFISDSINDVYFYFYNKKNIIYNPDKYFYLFKFNKVFNIKNYN